MKISKIFSLLLVSILFLGAGFILLFIPTGGHQEDAEESVSGFLKSFFPGNSERQESHSLDIFVSPPDGGDSFLTGLPIQQNPDEEIFTAIMVEESIAARPHFVGVEEALLSFEMPAEGGIPRLMLIYSNEKYPEKVGPVRSARHYFVEIAEGMVGSYVHAGGSPEALEMLQRSRMRNVDENLNDTRLIRDKNLYAPHNLFALPEEIFRETKKSFLEEGEFIFDENIPGYTEDEEEKLENKEEKNEDIEAISNIPDDEVQETDIETQNLASPQSNWLKTHRIDVNFSISQHYVAWEYNIERECYARIQKHETADICPDNLVILETNVGLLIDKETGKNEKGRLDIRTTGAGKMIFFRDGIVIKGTWRRSTLGAYEFFDEFDQKIPLKPGKTFVQVLDFIEKASFTEINGEA